MDFFNPIRLIMIMFVIIIINIIIVNLHVFDVVLMFFLHVVF